MTSSARWKRQRIGELAEKVQDGTHFSPRSTDGPYRYLTSKNIRMGRLDLRDSGWISEAEHRGIYRRCDPRKGDVLLTKDGANTGNVVVNPLDEEFSLLSSVAMIRCDESRSSGRFLYHVLASSSGRQQMEAAMAGNAISRLTLKKIVDLEVEVPPLEEQRRIAEVLDTIDESIRATERIIAKLESLSLGLHRELIHASGSTSDRRGWILSTVGGCMEIHDRLRQPLSVEERWEMQGRFPYYGPTGQLDSIDEFRFEGTFALIGEDGDHFLKFEVWPMTAVVSGRFNVNNHAHVLQGTPMCRTEWFAACFRHFDVGAALTRQGAGRFKLNQAALRLLSIPLPSIAEQDRILSQLETVLGRIGTERQEAVKLRQIRSGLTQDLLSGRRRTVAT